MRKGTAEVNFDPAQFCVKAIQKPRVVGLKMEFCL